MRNFSLHYTKTFSTLKQLARRIILAVYDAVFSGVDLLNNQFDDRPEIGEFFYSEHVKLRRSGGNPGNPHHLAYAIDVTSNSNNVNVYANAF